MELVEQNKTAAELANLTRISFTARKKKKKKIRLDFVQLGNRWTQSPGNGALCIDEVERQTVLNVYDNEGIQILLKTQL